MNNSDQTLENSVLGLLSGKSSEDPFPLFAQMRGISSVVPIPLSMGGINHQAWMVTRMEEAMQVLKDHTHFTVDRSSIDINSNVQKNLAKKKRIIRLSHVSY